MEDVWSSNGPGNAVAFLQDFKSRLYGLARNDMFEAVKNSSKCCNYKLVADNLLTGKLGNYFHKEVSASNCLKIVQFKCRNHHLKVESGSWERPKTPKPKRVCLTCKVVEDEKHLLVSCPLYDTLRSHYLGRLTDITDTDECLAYLLNTDDHVILNNVGVFLKKALYLHHQVYNR